MKGFIKLIIVIAVLGGIWFAWEQWKGNEAIQVDYQTEPLEKGDLMITIDATGVTEPDELVDVGAQVSGIIMEFGKDTGRQGGGLFQPGEGGPDARGN